MLQLVRHFCSLRVDATEGSITRTFTCPMRTRAASTRHCYRRLILLHLNIAYDLITLPPSITQRRRTPHRQTAQPWHRKHGVAAAANLTTRARKEAYERDDSSESQLQPAEYEQQDGGEPCVRR